MGEKNIEEITGGKVCVQREMCCNRTVEHIALGTRLLLRLQMVGRRFQLIYVMLWSVRVGIYLSHPCLYEAICEHAICLFSLSNVS